MSRPGKIPRTKADKYRGVRLTIAFALEGRGTAARKAVEWNTDPSYMSHAASMKFRHRSYRLETLMDAFIRETFAKHRHVLQLEAE